MLTIDARWVQEPPPALPAAPLPVLLDSTLAAAAWHRPASAPFAHQGALAPHQVGPRLQCKCYVVIYVSMIVPSTCFLQLVVNHCLCQDVHR